ncbi:MAG: hypothetical protein M1835_004334 [Candelina submexicana]|nr:MAG: hypothetical protein M1835_004334 [Candelina submexicana]
MIRVAVAGTGGLAQYIAHYLDTETSHQFILLSRSKPKPQLRAKDWQVMAVDYGDTQSLRFALTGVDTVISTISGQPQINLIDAAYNARVRRFAPAEFEGRPSMRPVPDALDRGKSEASQRLHYYRQYLESTSFVCGILYERFHPGGMASLAIGLGCGVSEEGDYLMDFRNSRAQIPHYNAAGQIVSICLTSARDVARFVVTALNLPRWPAELRMCGERMSVYDVVRTAEHIQGQHFEKAFYTPASLQDALTYAQALQDWPQQLRIQSLIATAESRYDFIDPTLNGMVGFVPTRFGDWLRQAWAGQ